MSSAAPIPSSGYSLHIGLNFVDPNHYDGWDGKLNACEYDALDMENISKLQRMTTKVLLREQARRDEVINAIANAAEAAIAGDLFLVTYSGHGGRLPDYSGDEADGKDETWCLFDGQLLDDELYELWSKFRADVRILVISDSCHSGTIYRLSGNGLTHVEAAATDKSEVFRPKAMPPRVMHNTFRANREYYIGLQKAQIERGWDGGVPEKSQRLQSTVRLLSGCMDSQFSYDGVGNGQFTGQLLRVWDNGRFRGNYDAFHRNIRRAMPDNQTPEHRTLGKKNEAFDEQKPFKI